MKQTIAIIHFNTPELTEAAILSLRKHGGEDYHITIFDNSDTRPFKKRMRGVKRIDNTKGQVIDFDKEMEKYPDRCRDIGCAKGCEFGSSKHMMTVQKLWELRGPLFTAHLPATMSVVAIGLIISIVLGMALAILMDASPVAEKALYPLVIASQTIPTTALAPLFVLWFGYSIWSKVLVTVLMTFFPVTITVFDGFRSVRTEMKELMFCMGADERQMFMKLKLPAVLPFFFSALKMAVPLSVIGAAIGEWLGAQSGLGYFSRRMMTQLDGAGVFAPILLLSVAAMLLTAVVTFLERRLVTWRNE